MNRLKKFFKDFFRGENGASLGMTAALIAVVIVLNVVVYVLTVNYGLYLFTPEETRYEISSSAAEYFGEAVKDGKRVEIVFCQPRDAVAQHATGSFVLDTAEQFASRYPDLVSLEFVNIITKRDSAGNRFDIDAYTTDEWGEPVGILKSSVIFRSGDRYKVVTDDYTGAGYADFFTLDSTGTAVAYNGEEVMTGMITRVLSEGGKVAYITTFHGETVDMGMRTLLTAAGFEIRTVDLTKSEVPKDAGLVVISNPLSDFARAAEGSGVRAEIDRLKSYTERGGSVYVAIDPYAKKLPVLEGFLAENGLSFTTAETQRGDARCIVRDPDNAITPDGFTLVTEFADGALAGAIGETVGKYDTGAVITSEAAALSLSGGAYPILVTTAGAEIFAGGETVGGRGSFCVFAAADVKGEVDGAPVTGHIFFSPSIFVSATDAMIAKGYANRDFYYALFEKTLGTQRPPYGANAVLYSTETLENLTMKSARLYTAAILLVPAILTVVGAVVLIRRKNR